MTPTTLAATAALDLRHRWLPQAEHGTRHGITDWECACGSWGNGLERGYAVHIEGLLDATRAENARLREWLKTCRDALDSFAGIAPIPDRPSLRILKEKP